MEVITRQYALANGLKRYFTGEPCTHGHTAERYTKGCLCCVCSDLRVKKWAKDHPERKQALDWAYRVENAEKIQADQRGRYEANRDLYKQRAAESQKRRREERNAYHRAYSAANAEAKREAQRKYRIENPAVVNAATARRRAAKRQRVPPWFDNEKVMPFYIEAAKLTASTGVPHEVDHIYPLRGKLVSGLHVAENLQVLPMRDNRSKSNR